MKKHIIITVLSLMGLAACNKDIVKDVNTGKAIDFRAALDTKGTEVTTNTLGVFYVTALTESGSTYFADESFIKNDEDNFFESSTDYYWPAEESLNFYAYYPDAASLGNTVEITIDSEAKTLTGYAPSEDISEHLDLVIAKATGNKTTNENTGVFLHFYHQLSQVEIKAKNENAGFIYLVKGIKIMNVAAKGDLDFSVTTQWTPDYDALTSYEVEHDEAITLGEESVSLMPAADDNAMLIPQTRAAWDVENDSEGNAEKGSYIAVLIQIQTKDGSRVFPSSDDYGWVAYPLGYEWGPGYKYIYTLNFTEGAGYVDPENTPDDPENPYQPGQEVLGGKMTFDTDVTSWYAKNSYSPNIDAGI